MLHFSSSIIFVTLLWNFAWAVPVQIEKRIDQTISDSTKAWQQACETASGSRDKCSNVAVAAFSSLQEAAGVCDQQNGADTMITVAKQFNNDPEMIRLAQIFVQQPRNSPDQAQIPYCQVAPKNPELNGLFHCQFAGSNFSKFSGDQSGNVPLGLTSVSPPGSCPAKPDGPVPDGVQLDTLVTSPIAASSVPPQVTSTAAAQGSAPVDVAAPSSTPVIPPVRESNNTSCSSSTPVA